jgi:hypothetical protein
MGRGERSINKPEERVIALDIGSVQHTGPDFIIDTAIADHSKMRFPEGKRFQLYG